MSSCVWNEEVPEIGMGRLSLVEAASPYLFPEFPTRLEIVKDRLESRVVICRGWLRSSYPTGAREQKTDCCKQNGPEA